MVSRPGLHFPRGDRSDSPPRPARDEDGYALLLALFVALMAAAAMMLGAAALKIEYDTTRRDAQRIRLDAMVDAAIAETLASRHLLGVARRPFADGWIESRVERTAARRAVVRARAGLGSRQRAAEVELQLTDFGPMVLSWRPAASSPP